VTLNGADLRALVREVVRDAVADLADLPAPVPTANAHNGFGAVGPRNSEEKTRVDTVRIATDADLDAFVRQLLRLFENPKSRADLRTGRLSFRLANPQTGGAHAATHRIDKGAVTERQIVDIASAGGTLTLGPKAVLTPLAREKARSLGVTITKERR
jgi:hypothetical protein